MKKRIFSLFFAVAAVLMLAAVPLSAEETAHVHDDANLFGASVSSLEKSAEELHELTGWNIMIITTNYAEDKETRVYAADYYEKFYAPSSDCVLYIIDMDNRQNAVVCGGVCENEISLKKQNLILDRTTPMLKSGKYASAASAFCGALEEFANGSETLSEPFSVKRFMVCVAIGVGIGAVVCLIALSKYKILSTPKATVYLDRKETAFKEKADIFLREHTTSRIISSDSGGSGGGHSGSFHSSSGGHYSGSSRGF